MLKVKGLIVGVGVVISSTLVFSQEIDVLGPPIGGGFSNSENTVSPQPPTPTIDTAVQIPVGEAPFFSALSSYILLLYPLYLQNHTAELQREADVLGLPLDEYQEVLLTLQLYRDRELSDWSERQQELCGPVLRTGEISNEEAILALTQLDNDTDHRNAIAQGVIEEVGEKFGDEVEAAVREHLESYRASLSVSRTDMIKFIELKTDVDHRTFFINQCQAM